MAWHGWLSVESSAPCTYGENQRACEMVGGRAVSNRSAIGRNSCSLRCVGRRSVVASFSFTASRVDCISLFLVGLGVGWLAFCIDGVLTFERWGVARDERSICMLRC